MQEIKILKQKQLESDFAWVVDETSEVTKQRSLKRIGVKTDKNAHLFHVYLLLQSC